MLNYTELQEGLAAIYDKSNTELRGCVDYDVNGQVAFIAEPDEILTPWAVLSLNEEFVISKDWIKGQEQLRIISRKR